MKVDDVYLIPGYRFGFQGQEKDDEITGVTGSHLNFGARIYDARIARWLSVDPSISKYPGLSPYSFVGNMPITAIDPNGEEIILKGSRRDKGAMLAFLQTLTDDDLKVNIWGKVKVRNISENVIREYGTNLIRTVINDDNKATVRLWGGRTYTETVGELDTPFDQRDVKINLSRLSQKEELYIGGEQFMPSYIDLGRELSVAQYIIRGIPVFRNSDAKSGYTDPEFDMPLGNTPYAYGGELSIIEMYKRFSENIIRCENKLPLRVEPTHQKENMKPYGPQKIENDYEIPERLPGSDKYKPKEDE